MMKEKGLGNRPALQPKGFSLVELLLVVAIILTIAAIAIPNLMRSRMVANEASAVGSLRTLNTACILYLTMYGGYPTGLQKLKPAAKAKPNAADLIDSLLVSGQKGGYTFKFSGTSKANGFAAGYTIKANPIDRGVTGQRSFFTDETGVIRANEKKAASVNSPPIG